MFEDDGIQQPSEGTLQSILDGEWYVKKSEVENEPMRFAEALDKVMAWKIDGAVATVTLDGKTPYELWMFRSNRTGTPYFVYPGERISHDIKGNFYKYTWRAVAERVMNSGVVHTGAKGAELFRDMTAKEIILNYLHLRVA